MICVLKRSACCWKRCISSGPCTPFGSAGQLSTSVVGISLPPRAMAVISTGLRLARAAYKPWLEYRAIFVNRKRVKLGLEFWNKYPNTLRRAEQKYGVPQEIIVAIIGVETIYGQNAGNFLVLDALATLAFDYPRRADFFRSELENYLLLAREQQFDLLDIRGSYAGALGIPQFMPGSYRNYAVDFNSNRAVDLLREDIDAIGSVANYLQGYGWVKELTEYIQNL